MLPSPTSPKNASDLAQKHLPPLFAFGQVLATPGALEALKKAQIEAHDLLGRHQYGDWGDVCEDDKAANAAALLEGARLLSAYSLPQTGAKIWIITEADRSATTLLLPEEY